MKFALANPEENEYGGVYLFENDSALEDFLDSPFLKDWGEHPDVSDLKFKKYQVLPDFTKAMIKPNNLSGDFVNNLSPNQ